MIASKAQGGTVKRTARGSLVIEASRLTPNTSGFTHCGSCERYGRVGYGLTVTVVRIWPALTLLLV